MPASAWPTLPPTATGSPASRKMAPVSSVVVVLPFVPVIPMTRLARKRVANSTSLHSGDAAAQGILHGGALVGHAGALDQKVDRGGQHGRVAPSRTSTPAARSSAAASSGGAAPSSRATTRAAGNRRRPSSAAGRPLRRRPSTARQRMSSSSTVSSR